MAKVYCCDCDWEGDTSQADEEGGYKTYIHHIGERVGAGEEMPAGVCPVCGALVVLAETDEEAAERRLHDAAPDLLATLKIAVAAFNWDADPSAPVNGGDMVEWFGQWREHAKRAVAKAEGNAS